MQRFWYFNRRPLLLAASLCVGACGADTSLSNLGDSNRDPGVVQQPVAPSPDPSEEPGVLIVPGIERVLPGLGAWVNPNVVVRVVFVEPMAEEAASTVTLTSETDVIEVSAAFDVSRSVLALMPLSPLPVGSYDVAIAAGAPTQAGDVLADGFGWSFVVVEATPK